MGYSTCFTVYPWQSIPPTDDQIYSEQTAKFYENLDFQCPGLGHLGPLGAQYRAPLVKSEFFFFCVFSRYLCDGESSVDPTLILQCRAPGLFIAKMIFREMFSALRKSGLLRHVTSRHVTSRFVTVNLFSNKRTPNGYYVSPWVNNLYALV